MLDMRYSDIKPLTEGNVKYLPNVIYPEIELNEDDIYVITSEGDRYDTLALQFYKNSSYWWIIAAANSEFKADSLVLKPGTQIRIPANPTDYIEQYNALNA